MWWDWIGGWVSHILAAYLGVIVGIIVGVWLVWMGENVDTGEDEHHHPVEGPHCPWCGRTTREDHRA